MISVVVCTYNRSELLPTVLQSLCRQKLDASQYEVIVVDNNSSDDTSVLVLDFCDRYPNIRYCFEPQQGLSHARNRGWREARGDYVAYIDDDAKAPEEWLAVAKEIIDEVSPPVFGGPYYAFYHTPKPRWYKDAYGSREHGTKVGPLDGHEYLSGGNMFVLRALLEAGQGFDPRLGMRGDKMAYGEETAWQIQVRQEMSDVLIYYDPDLFVYHLVPSGKMTLRWIVRRRFADGRYSYRVFGNHDSLLGHLHCLGMLLRSLLTLCLELARGLLARDHARFPYAENYWFECAFQHVQVLGWRYEQYRQRIGSTHRALQRLRVD